MDDDRPRLLRIARYELDSPDELIRSAAQRTVDRFSRQLGEEAAAAEGYPPPAYPGQYDLGQYDLGPARDA